MALCPHVPAVVDSAEDAAPEDYAAPWAAAQDSGTVPAAPAGRGLGAAALAAAVLAACAWVIRAAGRRGPLRSDTPYLSMAQGSAKGPGATAGSWACLAGKPRVDVFTLILAEYFARFLLVFCGTGLAGPA